MAQGGQVYFCLLLAGLPQLADYLPVIPLRAITIKTYQAGKYRMDRIANFLQFSLKNSIITKYLRELDLNGSHEGSVSLELLRGALEELVHLRVLRLRNLQIDNATSTEAAGNGHVTPQVRRSLDKMRIVLCSFPSRQLRDLLSIVFMFSEIEDLAINGDDWGISMDSHFYPRERPLMVRSLDLYDLHEACTSAICDMVRASRALEGHLTSLCFRRPHEIDGVRSFASLLYDAGSCLTTLEVCLSYSFQALSPIGE
ncbi:hypothetical protein C8T65DRAFT_98300 [Cerioporus squamosus]|nr:hypothetical protein C8T65DRAFT_98300 [Cerioporus squamosus]